MRIRRCCQVLLIETEADMQRRNEYAIRETEEYFGPLYPYIKNEKITDVIFPS